jgi:hypothetical protein
MIECVWYDNDLMQLDILFETPTLEERELTIQISYWIQTYLKKLEGKNESI